MTKVQLNQKEQHYADTREEAEEIVSAAKENDNLQMHKITEKHNKYGQYYLIDLTYSSVDGKGNVEVSDGQLELVK